MGNKKRFNLAATYQIDNSYDSERFLKLRICVMHDGKNKNNTSFDVAGMEKAGPTIANIPILANVVFDENGNPDFGGHDMTLVKGDDNKYRIIYKETPIGVVPENNNYEIVFENGRNYAYVDAYVWRGYSNYAEDLILKNGTTDISMEILVDAAEWSEQDDSVFVSDWRYTGITLLGEKYAPAMEGANATVQAFCAEESEAFQKLLAELNKEIMSRRCDGVKKDGDNLAEINVVFDDSAPVVDPEDHTPEEPAEPAVEPEAETMSVAFSTYKEKRVAIENALTPIYERNEEGKLISETHFWLCDFDDNWVFVEKCTWTVDSYQEVSGRFGYAFDEATRTATITTEFEEMVVKWLTKEEAAAIEEARNASVELNELREYKRKAEVAEVFAKFPDLEGNELFMSLKEDNEKFSIEELERECYVIRGKSMPVFNSAKSDGPPVIPVPSVKDISDENEPYNGIFKKFGIRK